MSNIVSIEGRKCSRDEGHKFEPKGKHFLGDLCSPYSGSHREVSVFKDSAWALFAHVAKRIEKMCYGPTSSTEI